MTDHIPLAEARPGYIVHLKPVTLDRIVNNGRWSVQGPESAFWIEDADIDHIERAPRVLKVGLAMLKGTDTQVEVVAIVDGWAAWVRKGHKASNGWKPVDDLEPVDD